MKKKVFLLSTAIFIVSIAFSQLKIGQTGNVSIGSCEPTSYPLKIKSSSGYVEIGATTTSTCDFKTDRSYFYFNKGFNMGSAYFNLTGSTNFTIKSLTQSFPSFVLLNSSGFVALNRGPNSPQYSLDVGGDINATGVVTWSDERHKDDIKETKQDEINQLYELKAKKYKLKKPEYLNDNWDVDKQHYGFIAQEFKDFYPDLVYEDSSGYLSINYIEMIPLLVEALKEQNKRIEYLETKVKDVKMKNSGSIDISEVTENVAQLMQNKPNPFSENTEIEFYLPETVEKATLTIYDLQGKQVKSMTVVEREYGSAVIYGSELQPGIYHYSLIADGEVIGIEKMILTD